MDNIDKQYMERCLQLATYGLGKVSPNPMVGCVIVCNNKIIGEGFHRAYGGAHAEVHAINSVKEEKDLKESTLYVNLEPCSHYGKTPPCSDLIIAKGIPKVVVANFDPNPLVAGKGIEKMKKAGIEVTTGILVEKAEHLNRRFFSYHKKHRPYIILKYAKSADGFIDKKRKDNNSPPEWITNEYCRTLVHKWRCEEDAFMVGTKTVFLDNPQLTSRNWIGKNPLRISIDESNLLNSSYNLLDGSTPSLIFTSETKENKPNIEYYKIDFKQDVIPQIVNALYKKSIQSLVVEGGQKLLQSFIDTGYWDEARVFTGEKQFMEGISQPKLTGEVIKTQQFGNSKLQIIYPKK